MKKCVFFDRDGIVNKPPPEGEYVERAEDFHIMPEFPGILRSVESKGYKAVIVSNQRGVARGMVSAEEVEAMHKKLKEVLYTEHGLVLLDIFYCPHNEGECDCRKPKPGMLLGAAKRHDIDLSKSWMIGDNERDIEAGRRAGCRTILVAADVAGTKADYKAASMKELKLLIAKTL